ncbi:PhzF family phenazine biosynthesis protein [Parafilimonas sp.]|uniref:PhzF family phenazine biosynthesis protein n=1 Tax=Parafilimonas sp. TaxID=1969739 RepID=UPI0039E2C9A0
MKLPIYIADAFTNKLFGGNPAAICPLQEWLPETTMQSLAAENNLSETAFIVQEGDHFRIRWFTPSTEVALCGHATLASAHIFYTELGYSKPEIHFNSLSGLLKVIHKDKNTYTLDFPVNQPETVSEIPEGLFEGLKIDHAPVFKTSFDYMVVMPDQRSIENLEPDFASLARVKARGVVTTAKGDNADFVSRCFYPQSGINEDPVTGSAHTIMVPYWAKESGKTTLTAIQLSKRKGFLVCELKGERVLMDGQAVTYLKGEYTI